MKCKIENCANQAVGRGWCKNHWNRWRRYGDPLAGKPSPVFGKYPKHKNPVYQIWVHMIRRCYDQRHVSYAIYGGRGITVCDRWRQSFDAFVDDMPPYPSRSHSIERIHNNKGYSPSNCCWKTRLEQGQNKRNNFNLTINGRTQNLSGWSRESPVTEGGIKYRLKRGWSAEDAVYTPRYNKGVKG